MLRQPPRACRTPPAPTAPIDARSPGSVRPRSASDKGSESALQIRTFVPAGVRFGHVILETRGESVACVKDRKRRAAENHRHFRVRLRFDVENFVRRLELSWRILPIPRF